MIIFAIVAIVTFIFSHHCFNRNYIHSFNDTLIVVSTRTSKTTLALLLACT